MYEILRIKYQMVSVNRLYGGGDDDDSVGETYQNLCISENISGGKNDRLSLTRLG